MPNEVLYKQGTQLIWNGTGTSDGTLAMSGLANGSAVQGSKVDLGATFARQFLVTVQVETGATGPTAGRTFEYYWGASHQSANGSANPGNMSGTSGTYIGWVNATGGAKQLQFIGALVLESTATAIQRQNFVTTFPARYGMPMVRNDSGQAATASTLNHEFRITPLIDEVQ